MLITERQRSWLGHRRSGPLHPVMQFVEDRLELGAGTVLARMAGDRKDGLDLEGSETRILALLAAAYRRPISASVLDHLRRAGREWARGEACLAQIHLAFTGLPRLDDPEDAAYRLFIAEGLLDEGTPPRDILRALDLDPSQLDRLDKVYSDTEARVPAGSGRPSGEWTIGGAIGSIATTADSFFSASASDTVLSGLLTFATRVLSTAAGPVVSLGFAFIPSPGESTVSDGEIPGYKGLLYHWDREEGRLILSWNIAGVRVPFIDAHIGLDGVYYDDNHHPVARETDGHLTIDLAAATSHDETPVKSATDGEVESSAQANAKNEPKLCPDPTPDVPHGAPERAIAYQERVTGLPRGLGVELNGVVFDGCRETDGTMIEAKAWGTDNFLDDDDNFLWWVKGKEETEWQLLRQSVAAGNRTVEWHVGEQRGANAIRNLARQLGLKNIVVIWDPQDDLPMLAKSRYSIFGVA